MPMAPTASSSTAYANKTISNGKFDSFQSWLAIYGNAEYVLYKKSAAPPHLSYEEWASSEHPLGPYLYHLTLEAWDEVSSSDEHVESTVKPAPSVQPGRGPTKKATTNCNGKSHTVDFSTPSPGSKTDEPVGSGKRRRRRSKKKILSDEIIASENGEESATLAADAKSEQSIKKQKLRKQATASSIPPEDIEESLPVAGAVTPTSAAASPDGPSSSSAPRRGLRIRTPAQQRPYLHHEKLFDELVETGHTNDANNKRISQPSSKLALVSYPNSATEDQLDDEDLDDTELEDLENSKPKTERRFKGKGRSWKKEESDEDTEYHQGYKAKKLTKNPAGRRKSRLSDVCMSEGPSDIKEERIETTSTEKKDKSRTRQRKSHKSEEFVKDDSSDFDAQAVAGAEEPKNKEDGDPDEITVESTSITERPKRKPRKSYLSKEFVGDDSDSEIPQPVWETQEPSLEKSEEPATSQSAQSKPKQRRKSRKHLSEEFIRDETDSDASQVANDSERFEITPTKSALSKSTPKIKLRLTKQTNSQHPSDMVERKGQSEDQENLEVPTNSSGKKGRKRKTGSSDSLGSLTH